MDFSSGSSDEDDSVPSSSLLAGTKAGGGGSKREASVQPQLLLEGEEEEGEEEAAGRLGGTTTARTGGIMKMGAGVMPEGHRGSSHQQHPSQLPEGIVSKLVLATPTGPTGATAGGRGRASGGAATGGGKRKRIVKTAEAAAATPRKVVAFPMDEGGRPILPITVGVVTLHATGTVVHDRPTFHNKRYIWPIGYHSSRPYLSLYGEAPEAGTGPQQQPQITYHSRILDGGAGPIFEVVSDEDPHQRYQSSTPTGAWTAVVKAVNAARGRDYANSASGPDFFGLSNPTISMIIENLSGAELCTQYQRKIYETSTGAPPPIPGASGGGVDGRGVDDDDAGADGDDDDGGAGGDSDRAQTVAPLRPIPSPSPAVGDHNDSFPSMMTDHGEQGGQDRGDGNGHCAAGNFHNGFGKELAPKEDELFLDDDDEQPAATLAVNADQMTAAHVPDPQPPSQ